MNKKETLQVVALFINGMVNFFLLNISNAYLVYVLGVSNFGDFSLTIKLIFYLAPFFSVGLTSLLAKHLPVFQDNNDTLNLNIFLKWNLKILLRSLSIIGILLVVIIIFRTTGLDNMPCLIFKNCESYRQTFGDLKFVLPIALLLLWNSALLSATKNILASQLLGRSSITYSCALVIFIINTFFASSQGLPVILSIFFGFLALCLLQYIAIILLLVIPKIITIRDIVKQSVTEEISKAYLKDGVSLLINSIIYVLQGLAPILIIEWICKDDTMLGDYFIVLFISSISTTLVRAFSKIIRPYYSNIHNEDRKSKLQKIINYQLIFGGLWTIFVVFDFLILNSTILGFYGGSFVFSTFSVCFLMTYNYFSVVIFHAEKLCLFNNLNRFLYPTSIIQTTLMIILCFLLIPHFFYLGAIFAIAISQCLSAIACWIIIRIHRIDIKILGII